MAARKGGKAAPIVVIALQFGPFPATFPLWLHSVAANAGVRFVLFTDQPVAEPPANLDVVTTTLAETHARINAVLGRTVCLARPYKLCDYRPMFGEIFAREIGAADYWGHCDLDIVFGDILPFVSPALGVYDKILVLGNFSLYRNTLRMNGLYRIKHPGADWEAVAATEMSRHFDEHNGVYKIVVAEGVSLYEDAPIADITWKRSHLTMVDSPKGAVELFYRQDGKVFRWAREPGHPPTVDERLLIHLQKRPLQPLDTSRLTPDLRVYFLPGGFLIGTSSEVVDEALARRLNPPNAVADLGLRMARVKRKLRSRLAV